VKALIPSIAAKGRKLREEEELASARLHLIGSLHAGEFIGHREIMRGETHTYTVIASTPCKNFTLHGHAVAKLLAEHPSIALQLQSALGCSICCENETAALKAFRDREEGFQRVAGDYRFAKLNTIGPNTSAPRKVSSALSVFVGMSMRIFGSGNGRCEERDVVLNGDEDAEGVDKRTLVCHRRSIQEGLDSAPKIAAARGKCPKELTVERHYDAIGETPPPGTATRTGTNPPPSNASTAPGTRAALSVSISACATASASVSSTFSPPQTDERAMGRLSKTLPHPVHKEAALVSLLYNRSPFRGHRSGVLSSPGLFSECAGTGPLLVEGAEMILNMRRPPRDISWHHSPLISHLSPLSCAPNLPHLTLLSCV
jgi:hypothetical protein